MTVNANGARFKATESDSMEKTPKRRRWCLMCIKRKAKQNSSKSSESHLSPSFTTKGGTQRNTSIEIDLRGKRLAASTSSPRDDIVMSQRGPLRPEEQTASARRGAAAKRTLGNETTEYGDLAKDALPSAQLGRRVSEAAQKPSDGVTKTTPIDFEGKDLPKQQKEGRTQTVHDEGSKHVNIINVGMPAGAEKTNETKSVDIVSGRTFSPQPNKDASKSSIEIDLRGKRLAVSTSSPRDDIVISQRGPLRPEEQTASARRGAAAKRTLGNETTEYGDLAKDALPSAQLGRRVSEAAQKPSDGVTKTTPIDFEGKDLPKQQKEGRTQIVHDAGSKHVNIINVGMPAGAEKTNETKSVDIVSGRAFSPQPNKDASKSSDKRLVVSSSPRSTESMRQVLSNEIEEDAAIEVMMHQQGSVFVMPKRIPSPQRTRSPDRRQAFGLQTKNIKKKIPNYDDYDWTELPPRVKAAAKVLGYNRNLWNSDMDTLVTNKMSKDLTANEVAAAKIMGYTKSQWDAWNKSVGRYDDYNWSELTDKTKAAAKVLGYNKKIWDSDRETRTSHKHYHELTPDEKLAALALGYTAEKWAQQKYKVEDQHYEDYDWSELPPKAKSAAKVFGYGKLSWRRNKITAASKKKYSELNAEERAAAKVLGYNTAKQWDQVDQKKDLQKQDSQPKTLTKDEGRDEAGSFSFQALTIGFGMGSEARQEPSQPTYSDETAGQNYDDCDWSELPPDAQAAAKVLGYTKKLWDSGKETSVSNKDYSELTAEEKSAASVLGYTEAKWNGDDESVEDLPYDDYDWAELPAKAKEAAKILGYSKKLWDSDSEIPTWEKKYSELTEAERAAALVLGYPREKWPTKSSYADYEWSKLPRKSMAAANVLGYLKELWDSNQDPPFADKKYSKLTAEERSAAKLFGFDTAEKWDREQSDKANPKEEKAREETPKQEKPQQKPKEDLQPKQDKTTEPCLDKKDEEAAIGWSFTQAFSGAFGIGGEESKEPNNRTMTTKSPTPFTTEDVKAVDQDYQDKEWSVLPDKARTAAKVLGYNQETWDADKVLPICHKDYSELTEKEKSAALVLGYTAEKWAGQSDDEVEHHHYDDYDWSDLSPQVQAAAKVMGYSQESWDADKALPVWKTDYSQLSDKEKWAAKVLGYSSDNWPHQSKVVADHHYEDYSWSELPTKVKSAAKEWGYSKRLWDDDEDSPLWNKAYNELTPQRWAAVVMGYDTPDKWRPEKVRTESSKQTDTQQKTVLRQQQENKPKHVTQDDYRDETGTYAFTQAMAEAFGYGAREKPNPVKEVRDNDEESTISKVDSVASHHEDDSFFNAFRTKGKAEYIFI